MAPEGSFHSTQDLQHDFFSMEADTRRDDMIKEGMPFLHSLVTAKLADAKTRRQSRRTTVATAGEELIETIDENIPLSDLTHFDINGELIEEIEGVSYVKPSKHSIDSHRLEKVCLMNMPNRTKFKSLMLITVFEFHLIPLYIT